MTDTAKPCDNNDVNRSELVISENKEENSIEVGNHIHENLIESIILKSNPTMHP